MKKVFTLVILAVLAVNSFSFGQLALYDGFTGTGNIGGDCSDASCNANGWYTHSNSKPATIDIISGNLSYSGLQAPTGNKVYITGNTMELARDVNAAVVISGDVAYFSALIKVIDNTNLGDNASNYFMHFGATSGNSVTSFYSRLGIKSSNSGTSFRLSIMNTSSGTFEEHATDLTFGTTYLVVVKYQFSINTSTLWVNPATLGGNDPAGAVTASNGNTATAIASVCIRNGYDTGASVGTPKAEIDEIRVGTTFASVTPLSTGINTLNQSIVNIYPNPSQDIINVDYDGSLSSIKIFNTIGAQVLTTTENIIDISSLQSGVYFIQVSAANGSKLTQKIVKN